MKTVPAAICWLLAASATLLLVACSMPEAPTIKPNSATVTAVTPQGITMNVVLDVHNPNGFALKARSVKAKLTLGGKVELGPINVKRAVELPAKRTTKLSVNIVAPWQSAAEVATLAAGSPTIPYVVKAEVVVGGKNLNAKVPVTIKGTVTQAELLKAGIKGLPQIPGLPKLPDLSL